MSVILGGKASSEHEKANWRQWDKNMENWSDFHFSLLNFKLLLELFIVEIWIRQYTHANNFWKESRIQNVKKIISLIYLHLFITHLYFIVIIYESLKEREQKQRNYKVLCDMQYALSTQISEERAWLMKALAQAGNFSFSRICGREFFHASFGVCERMFLHPHTQRWFKFILHARPAKYSQRHHGSALRD